MKPVFALLALLCACAHAAEPPLPPGAEAPRPHQLLTLEQAYDRTLASDQSIRNAWYELRKARLQPWSALTRMGPSLIGSANYQTSQVTTFSRDAVVDVMDPEGDVAWVDNRRRADTHSRFVGFTLEQPILDLTVIPAYKNAKLSVYSARLQYRFTIREILFGVAQAYYDVLKLQSLVGVAQQTVDLASDQLGQAENRYEVGQVARIDVLRAQASLEEARNQLIQNQGSLEIAQDTLSNILNFGGRTNFVLAEPPNAPDTREPIAQALTRAFEHREDFRISAVGIEQEKLRRAEIVASYGPRIAAQASTQWQSNSGSNSNRTRVNSGVISVQVPFLTGGQREIDLRNAGHLIAQSRLNYEKAGKTVEADVKTAWVRVKTGREAIKALRAAVDSSQQNYKDLQSQYEAGTATSLDVQVALRELNNTRSLLTNEVYDYQIALRDLQRAQASFEASRVQAKAQVPAP